MGAGRTNATPNLNDGNIFIGDSNNVATTASFTTKVANATSGKADTSGDTFTGDVSFNDNVKAKFGNSDDLLIYHNTSAGDKSVIEDTGAGGLDVITNGNAITFHTDDGDLMLGAYKNDGVTLLHDNYIKFQTTGDGIRVWDDAQFDTNINVDGNITVNGTVSGATFTGNVAVGIPPSGTETLTVAGVTNLYGGADLQNTDITDVDTLTAKNVDISTAGTVTTNIATGLIQNIGDTKTLNLGTGFSNQGTTNINIGSSVGTTNIAGNVTVGGTVDGVDVGVLKYSDTDYFTLRKSYSEHLSTTYKNIPQYDYIFDKATPMVTMRILDLTTEVNWLDTIYNGSEYQNDLQVQCTLVVPSGTTNAVSLGSVTPTSGGGYVVGSSYHGWFFVSGDVTHWLNDFGKIHENSNGGSFERSLLAYQYDPVQDRTYLAITTYPTSYSAGTTLYWHPYAWETAGTLLNDTRSADEKGRSGQESLNFRWKAACDDRLLRYKLQIKEMSASSTQPDRAIIGHSMLKITRQEP